jgi:hypothetical protein
MGLDMYLTGEKYFFTNWEHPEKNLSEDGFKLKSKLFELGYWRKHPNLHGFIVQTFAEGKDECQDIHLYEDDIKRIISAVESGSLPATSGFFFGTSDGNEKETDLITLRNAIDWLNTKEPNVSKSIIYRASW